MAVLRYVGILLILMFSASISWTEEVTYRDKMGRVVKIAVPVKRAVLLQTLELIPALNIWNKIVGIGKWAYDNDLIKATKPDIKKTIPSMGSGADVNVEALLKVKPDVVITWSYYPETVRFMEEKGLKVIAIFPESFSELYDVMRLHGRLFGKEKEMEHSIDEMEKIFKLIEERVSRIPAHKRRKVLWLYNKPTSVACKGIIDEMLKRIRGINPAAGIRSARGGSAEVSIERITVWNPDVIFIWGYAHYTEKDILNNPQLRFIKAVKEGRVYKAPERWSTWSPRLAPIALWTAMKTYPEYFKDINLYKITDDFYRKVFGISFSKVKRFGKVKRFE